MRKILISLVAFMLLSNIAFAGQFKSFWHGGQGYTTLNRDTISYFYREKNSVYVHIIGGTGADPATLRFKRETEKEAKLLYDELNKWVTGK